MWAAPKKKAILWREAALRTPGGVLPMRIDGAAVKGLVGDSTEDARLAFAEGARRLKQH